MIAHAEFQSLGADVSRTESVAKHRPRDQTAEAKSVSLTVFVSIMVIMPIAVVASIVIVVSIAVVVPLMIVVPIAVVSMTVIVASIVVTAAMIVVMSAALVIRFVFSGPYEVHRPIAGIILSAIPAPILCMAGRYVQIDGRRRGILRHDQHRLRIDQRRRSGVAELNLAIDTGRYLSR